MLNSPRTGHPEALLEGSLISARRTGASAALAAGLLAGEQPDRAAGVVGCGTINFEILRFLRITVPCLQAVTLFDTDPARVRSFAERCAASWPDLTVGTADSAVAALTRHRLVSVATTAVRPHLDTTGCAPGTLVLHVSLRDLTPQAILVSRNVVDDPDHVCREQTSLHLAEQLSGERAFIHHTIGELLRDGAGARRDPEGVTVFSPFGLGSWTSRSPTWCARWPGASASARRSLASCPLPRAGEPAGVATPRCLAAVVWATFSQVAGRPSRSPCNLEGGLPTVTPVPPELDAYLDDHRDYLIDQLKELIRIPAVAVEGGPAIRQMAERGAAKCQEAGLDARIEDTGGHPVVYAGGGPDDAPLTLLTYGHYDVFPVSGQPGWRTDPFEPVVSGDRIYARGAGDNKGQFLAHLNALQWWQREAGGLPIKVKVILDGEEEAGSPHLPEFIERNRDELAADLCVYSDGPMLAGDRPALLFGVRGALGMELHASGPAQPLHSGNFGGVVANPVLDLARLLAGMVAPNGDLRVPGADKGLPEVTPVERAALDGLELDAEDFRARTGVEPLPQRFGEPFYERLLYKPSFNVSGIAGGHTGAGARTLIPVSAMARVDMRLVGQQDPAEVLAAVRRFVREQGFANVEVRKLFSQPPSRTPLDHPYADLVEQAVAEGFGRRPARVPSLAGTTPDYVFTRLLGVPSIMVPFAPADENHHAPNESM